MPSALKCPMPRRAFVSDVPLGEGCRGLRRLQQITNRNPWFAVASAVAHGGEVEYETAQRVADHLAKLPPRAFLDPAYGVAAVKSAAGGVGFGGRRNVEEAGGQLAAAAKCFIDACTRNPKERGTACVTSPARRTALARCLIREKTSVSTKAASLALEYLGDPEAVAVDRHAMNFACSRSDANCVVDYEELRQAERNRLFGEAERKARKLPSWGSLSAAEQKREIKRLHLEMLRSDLHTTKDPADETRRILWRRAFDADGAERFDRIPVRAWQKGDKITPANYKKGQRIIREEAKKVGTTPAALQVSAWLLGTCQFRTTRRKPGENWKLTLAAGESKFDCANALPLEERKEAQRKRRAFLQKNRRAGSALGGFTREELATLGLRRIAATDLIGAAP